MHHHFILPFPFFKSPFSNDPPDEISEYEMKQIQSNTIIMSFNSKLSSNSDIEVLFADVSPKIWKKIRSIICPMLGIGWL